METKVCSKCGRDLPLEKYGNDKRFENRLKAECKDCVAKRAKKYAKENPDKLFQLKKKWRDSNPEKVKEQYKRYMEDNVEKMSEYKKEYNKDEMVERDRIYYIENREKIKKVKDKHYQLYGKQIYQENKEEISIQHKKYHEENIDRDNARSKKWKHNNPDKINISSQKRRARKLDLPATLNPEQWEQIKMDFSHKCAYCGEELPLVQEHFVALTKGGEYTTDNIIPSCQYCNSSKGVKDFNIWYPNYKTYTKEREEFILTYLNYEDGYQQLRINIK